MNDSLTEITLDKQTGALNPAKTTRMLLRLIRALQPISRIEIARRLEINRRGCWEKYASAASAAALYTGDRASFDKSKMPRFVEIVAPCRRRRD